MSNVLLEGQVIEDVDWTLVKHRLTNNGTQSNMTREALYEAFKIPEKEHGPFINASEP